MWRSPARSPAVTRSKQSLPTVSHVPKPTAGILPPSLSVMYRASSPSEGASSGPMLAARVSSVGAGR